MEIQQAEQAGLAELAGKFKNGANWFYWVAGLSLVNSLIGVFGGEWSFIFGLGATQFVDAIALAMAEELPDSAGIIKTAALVISGLILGAVAVLGWLSGKGITPVFLIGIALYVLDGLLFVLVADWLSVAFHAFAAYQMISGVRALGEFKRALAANVVAQAQAVAPPVAPGV